MTVKFSAVLVLVWSLLCSISHAADGDRAYRVLAINTVETCSDLNTAVAIANDDDDWRLLYTFSLYTMGYLTGVNRLALAQRLWESGQCAYAEPDRWLRPVLHHRPDDDLEALKDVDDRIGIGLGVIDIKVNHVESPDDVARRIETATGRRGPDRIRWVHPD